MRNSAAAAVADAAAGDAVDDGGSRVGLVKGLKLHEECTRLGLDGGGDDDDDAVQEMANVHSIHWAPGLGIRNTHLVLHLPSEDNSSKNHSVDDLTNALWSCSHRQALAVRAGYLGDDTMVNVCGRIATVPQENTLPGHSWLNKSSYLGYTEYTHWQSS